ncbi:AtpZ/AtpI family protein [Mesorhizobium sp. AR02]|uniref:AtpZ/AtpI family protein n=1 Tax=Mesorhizobium sp. AR02 TaxID=2865837 RepID=UPI00215F8DEE|nr:AtpZ/AtpI family protein [Mesorhizobium sp. AR02]UVK54040.1 AtpZ/AtpI family protein [Mesorhizobium sp. AR02]
MADKNGPGGTGETGRGKHHEADIRDDDLERRRRELEASLATRLPNRLEGKDDAKAGSAAGYGQAVKLSSEFIAGVVVGAGIGWIIDRMAGTSPWGLIVFLLLGFGAGILNVMRSAGVVAEFGQGDKSRSGRDDSK